MTFNFVVCLYIVVKYVVLYLYKCFDLEMEKQREKRIISYCDHGVQTKELVDKGTQVLIDDDGIWESVKPIKIIPPPVHVQRVDVVRPSVQITPQMSPTFEKYFRNFNQYMRMSKAVRKPYATIGDQAFNSRSHALSRVTLSRQAILEAMPERLVKQLEGMNTEMQADVFEACFSDLNEDERNEVWKYFWVDRKRVY